MTVGTIKSLLATYSGRSSVNDLNPSNLTPAGVNIDLALVALNAARRKAERLVDFRYAEIPGALSIASTGTLLSAATGLGSGATVKRVVDVELPIAGSDYIPIEFLREDEWIDRVRRQVGRTAYNAAATLASLGVSSGNPIAYQHGQTIFLVPASQFTFPVAARINVIRFMPDYTADGDSDFFCQVAPEYLQWQGTLELNKLFRRFQDRQEGNIGEKEIEALAQEALQTLIQWNQSIDTDTSTPPGD